MTEKRFKVALSFPGEHREYVLSVAEALSEKLGRDAILYDTWYKAEFTMPDLDDLPIHSINSPSRPQRTPSSPLENQI